jgi:thymidylate kinase
VNLPIIEQYLAKKNKHKDIYIPIVEHEYILLIIRLLLKNAFVPFSLQLPPEQWSKIKKQKTKGIVRGSAYDEFVDLNNRANREIIDKALEDIFPFIEKKFFYQCEKIIQDNNSLQDYFRCSKKLKEQLKPYSYHSKIVGFYKSFYRINQLRINKLFKQKIKSKKIPENGGRIFAFIGGDGAGKSTNIEKLSSILSKHFYTETIHIGRPKKHIVGAQVRNAGKVLQKLNFTSIGQAINYLGVAVERSGAFKKALKIRAKGGVVILDRLPTEGITRMDCPRIHTIENNKYSWLAGLEKKIYAGISGVDEIIVLKLDPKIAIQRRPEDDADELLVRSGQIWDKDFSKTINATVIDTNNSFDFVEERILNVVWESINSKPSIHELVGLAGSGKSTSKNTLTKNFSHATYALQNKRIPVSLISNFLKYTKVYLKTKNSRLVKNYLKTDIFLNDLKRGTLPSTSLYIFDQGPLFYLSRLIVEVPSLEKLFINDLLQILPYYQSVIFLDAPLDVLYERINGRDQEHRVKGLPIEEQKQLLERFEKVYSNVARLSEEKGVKLHRINTGTDSIERVEEKLNEIFQAK